MEVFVQNSYVLVTGASSGIGKQCAIQLSQNYNLILCARREDKLIETKNMCKNPNNHLIFPYDLSDVDNLEETLIEFIKSKNITVEKYLHSAGTIGMLSLKLVTSDFILNCLKINLISAHLITKVLASKKHNEKALNNVVFISSNIVMGGGKALVYTVLPSPA